MNRVTAYRAADGKLFESARDALFYETRKELAILMLVEKPGSSATIDAFANALIDNADEVVAALSRYLKECPTIRSNGGSHG